MSELHMPERDKENTTMQTPPSERGRFARLLNESQRRSLTITLRRVELAVWRLEERMAQPSPPQLILTRFTNPPDPEQQEALLRLTRRVREEIAQLAFDYDLEVGEENVLRSVMGKFSMNLVAQSLPPGPRFVRCALRFGGKAGLRFPENLANYINAQGKVHRRV